MRKIAHKWTEIQINKIRLPTKAEDKESCYDSNCYLLKEVGFFPEETVYHLLQIHPIYAVQKKRIYEVVAGARTFCIAAHCLPPDQTIPLSVIQGSVSRECIKALRYIDIALAPLVLSFQGPAANLYRHLKLSDHDQAIFPSIFPTQRSFARALGISPSALADKKMKSGNHSAYTDHEFDGDESDT